jgi:hypothetical protein
LTPEEKAFILSKREKDKRVSKKAELKLRVLKIAGNYESWLQANGRGSSFSTFVDEFGFDEHGASEFFRRVEKVRVAATVDD